MIFALFEIFSFPRYLEYYLVLHPAASVLVVLSDKSMLAEDRRGLQ